MIESIKKRFAAGSFSRHAATLMSGTLVAQLIGFASLPFLTRLYTVADFGEYALYFAVAGFGAVIATGRYEMAIMLPKRDRDAINLVALSVLIAVSLSSFVLVLISIVGLFCNRHGICEPFPIWVYLIPATILLSGIYQAINYWLSRNKQFYILSQARVAQAIVTAVVGLTLGYVGMSGGMGLIYGGVAGQFVCTLMLVWAVKWKLGFDVKFISSKRMQLNALRYKDFPAINSLHVALDTVQTSVLPLMIGAIFGKIALGYYSFALRIIGVPVGLLSSTMSQVFFQRASENYSRKGKLYPLLNKLQTNLAALVIPVFFLLMLIAPLLFGELFGKDWEPASVVVQILCPWLCLNIFASVISQLPVILGKQKEAFILSIKGKITVVASLAIGWWFGLDIYNSLVILSVLMSIYAAYVIYWTHDIAKQSDMRNVA